MSGPESAGGRGATPRLVLRALASFRSRRRGKTLARDLVEILGLAVFLSIALRVFVVQAFYIPSGSMENTLLVNDMLLINKLVFRFRAPERGEILVFRCPTPDPYSAPKDYIKRVVGVPGDRLSVKDGKLLRNGVPVDEPFIKEPMDETLIQHAHRRWNPRAQTMEVALDAGEITVPPGHLFMMGDNRNHSQDSRYWGILPAADVIGKATFLYWPLSRMGFVR